MPYDITTKDGITIKNIPDDVMPDSQALKDRVAKIRAEKGLSAPVPVEAPAPEPQTTASGLAGAATRGLAPYVTGAAAGGPMGALAVGVAKMVGDPVVGKINQLLDQFGLSEYKQATPSEAFDKLLDVFGVARPQTQAEHLTQAGAEVVGSTGSSIGAGAQMMRSTSPVVAGVGQTLASNPAGQYVGGLTGLAAGEGARQLGAGPMGQLGANLIGGMLASHAVTPKATRPAVVQAVEPTPVQQPLGRATPMSAELPATVGIDPKTLEELRNTATGIGPGAKAARQQLAEIANVDPKGLEAAAALGVDVPPDLFAQDLQFLKQIGVTRSIPGSTAQAAFEKSVGNVVKRFDEVMAESGANFVEGVPAPAVVSSKVKNALVSTRGEIETTAKKIYDKVDAAIPRPTVLPMTNLKKALQEISAEQRGQGLSGKELELGGMLASDKGFSYGLLRRMKDEIGAAQAKGSDWGDMKHGQLKRLYGALAEDQLAAAEAAGGAELRTELRAANALTSQRKALEKRITESFGRDLEGSLAYKMKDAVSGSAAGDTRSFAAILKTVPPELRRETVATSLAMAFRGKGSDTGFNLAKFAQVYPGLRANEGVYAEMIKALGPEYDQILKNMHTVAKATVGAQGRIERTGRIMAAEGLMHKILTTTAGKASVAGAASMGGPLTAVPVQLTVDWLNSRAKPALVKAGDLFASEPFKAMMADAATGKPVNPTAIKKVVYSPPYQRFAKVAGAPTNPNEAFMWFYNGLRADTANKQEQK